MSSNNNPARHKAQPSISSPPQQAACLGNKNKWTSSEGTWATVVEETEDSGSSNQSPSSPESCSPPSSPSPSSPLSASSCPSPATSSPPLKQSLPSSPPRAGPSTKTTAQQPAQTEGNLPNIKSRGSRKRRGDPLILTDEEAQGVPAKRRRLEETEPQEHNLPAQPSVSSPPQQATCEGNKETSVPSSEQTQAVAAALRALQNKWTSSEGTWVEESEDSGSSNQSPSSPESCSPPSSPSPSSPLSASSCPSPATSSPPLKQSLPSSPPRAGPSTKTTAQQPAQTKGNLRRKVSRKRRGSQKMRSLPRKGKE
ncbi:sialidase-like [Elgaria multicarinata webbii]|uniref:sialidase-like n=1 Tax=Elgaria multicarinata webbii TaxID=159646 RepID=UPI002FCCD6EA